ncbi:MAG: Flp family type IVb pilin [Elusimicrobia bacterium CG08_land_8_20_14_0_20_44_26]|nr:MAG: Flp family type IVb pilin [Elusimicrobia bacterium CG08_land_8_20_14_0_20_44_26]
MRLKFSFLRNFRSSEDGAGMTEYILIVFLIALAAYLAVKQYGKTVSGRFIGAGNKVESAWGD